MKIWCLVFVVAGVFPVSLSSAEEFRCRTMWAVTTAYTSVHGEVPGSKTCAGEFPLGTLLIVPGYGDCIVRGRMGVPFRHYWHVNLRFGRHDRAEAAREWGRRQLPIMVCEYHPGEESP